MVKVETALDATTGKIELNISAAAEDTTDDVREAVITAAQKAWQEHQDRTGIHSIDLELLNKIMTSHSVLNIEKKED